MEIRAMQNKLCLRLQFTAPLPLSSSTLKSVIFGMVLPKCPQKSGLYSQCMRAPLNRVMVGKQAERNLPGDEQVICQTGNEK